MTRPNNKDGDVARLGESWPRLLTEANTPSTGRRQGFLQRMKSVIRRSIAYASYRGGQELFGDQQEINRTVLLALEQLSSAVLDIERQLESLRMDDHHPAGTGEQFGHIRADLEDLRKRIVMASAQVATGSPDSASHGDAMELIYADFEDTFRGSQELVESRLSAYLPWVMEGFRAKKRPSWLDLGCGRGEWLRLLAKEGIDARGVDGNPGMVSRAFADGLAVELGDLIPYLGAVPSASLDGLSAFHVVEHLPLEALISLLREGQRVLRPGGLLILETPNPENLQVGANTFYLDPTHRRPIPPAFLEFLVKRMGWNAVVVQRLHPDAADLAQAQQNWRGDSGLLRVAQQLYGPRDYAILAKR
jgi:SAM-dependent methyltransferase